MRKINTIIAIIITVIMLFSVVAIYAKPTSTIQSISENESMEEETTEAEPGETTFDEIEETTYINRVEKEWIEDATTNLPWDIDISTTSLKDTSLKETEETTKQYDVYKYRGYSYNILEDGTVRIVGFYPPTVPEGMVTLELSGIPSEIDGKRVTCIGRSAFVGIRVCYNFSGQYTTEYYDASSVDMPAEFYYNEDPNFDWAVLKMNGNIGQHTGWLGFGFDGNMVSKILNVIGYPNNIYTGQSYIIQFEGQGTVLEQTSNKISYTNPSYHGISGAPLLEQNSLAYGIHSMSHSAENYRSGCYINELMFQFILDYKEEGKDLYGY